MIEITRPMLGKRTISAGIWRQHRDGTCVPRGERGWKTVNGFWLNVGRYRQGKRKTWGRTVWIGLNWRKRLARATHL